jgi:AraC family transcriptional regulator of adaptative response / DNA-3-methyladenine glycosylase II
MRVLADPDVFLPGDVAVRSGAAAIGLPAEPRALDVWAAGTAPWRSYLTAHLWRAVPPRAPLSRKKSDRSLKATGSSENNTGPSDTTTGGMS